MDSALVALGYHLNTAIYKILDITSHLMSRRRALHKKTKSYALHKAADQKTSGDHYIDFAVM